MPRVLRSPDEQVVLTIRRHWWVLVRTLFPLLFTAALLPTYAGCEVVAPIADLSRFEGLFLTCDLAMCGVLLLRWLCTDLAPWWTEPCVITTRRIISRQGVWVRESREAALSAIGDITCAVPRVQERFFQFGDVTIQVTGRRNPLVFGSIPRPRRVQAALVSQARASRAHTDSSRPDGGAIGAALGRIFPGTTAGSGNPTLAIDPITPQAVRAQRRLSLLPNEVVLRAGRRHGTALAGRLCAPLAVVIGLSIAIWKQALPIPWSYSLAALAGLAIWVAWAVYDWRIVLHVLTTHRVLEMRCSPIEHVMPRAVSLSAVEDIVLRQVILGGSLWRVGTLVIDSGSDSPFRLRAVADPDALQGRLFETVEAARRLTHLREQERLAATLTDWFEEYHRLQLQS